MSADQGNDASRGTGEGKCWGLKWCIARVDCLPDCAEYGGKIEKKVDQ